MRTESHQTVSPWNRWFTNFATRSAQIAGSPLAFLLSIICVIGWLVTGPLFKWSDTWQLFINSITNVVTFVVVFVIQNSQNRDSAAINLKLNELIHASAGAREELIDIEKLSDKELEGLYRRYERIKTEWTRRSRR